MRRLGLCLTAIVVVLARDSSARRPVTDYRYFRALSIDLQGRPPTLAELAELDKPDFDLDHWIDAHLTGPGYVERIRRIYMDLLKLELPASYRFEPGMTSLYSVEVAGPTGPIDVYYRRGQRRADPRTDGGLCFTDDETGLKIPEAGRKGVGTAKPISQKLLDERTVVIKPWWLYADYRSAKPKDLVGPGRYPGLEVDWSKLVDPDGASTTAVRVCREEAQTAERGRVLATGRKTRADLLALGRRAPLDTEFATSHVGQPVSCLSGVGYRTSAECGCGVGLERCLPESPMAFVVAMQAPLGISEPFVATPRPTWYWLERWWTEEAVHFMNAIFEGDRDVRELVTSRGTVVNGPLSQFYRFLAGATCCGNTGPDLGFTEPEPLFDPAAVPKLDPLEVATWTPVADRGAHAAGLMTMPVFLTKYGTRRARAHVIYSTFLCKDFTADKSVTLTPSSEPDLMVREGCSACHMTLEPLAAFFTRVQESDWTYLPGKVFPVSLDRCRAVDAKHMAPECRPYYDPAFTDASHTMLRGGYGDKENIEKGPPGFAAEIAQAPEFAPCVVQNVAQSLLGRQLGADDAAWKGELAQLFVRNGYRMRPLVRAILGSAQYRPVGAP